ncbi:MAG: FAD-binding oxidoreductase, partial [Alphaproteobacteria bacterium]
MSGAAKEPGPDRHPATGRPLDPCGWGYADEVLSADERAVLDAAVAARAPEGVTPLPPPLVEEFSLPEVRLKPPPGLEGIVTTAPAHRLRHAFGRSFADIARLYLRQAPHAPDVVARPSTEKEAAAVLDWAVSAGAAVIPFGGGSSVCGGVEPDVGGLYPGVVSLDMTGLNEILEIDRTSRAARIQAGIYGPALEDALRPHGLTLRHYPQSFEFSTLGGWIATRSGGHYATLYTHIDDFVESTRSLTPQGALETRRLPGSGAGPSPDRLMIGSEGTLGVITEAWMRLQDRPRFRGSASISFPDMTRGTGAVRALSQSGLFPANCRLLDPEEARMNGIGDGQEAILILGFESADHPLEAWLSRALELAA